MENCSGNPVLTLCLISEHWFYTAPGAGPRIHLSTEEAAKVLHGWQGWSGWEDLPLHLLPVLETCSLHPGLVLTCSPWTATFSQGSSTDLHSLRDLCP